MTDFSRNVFVNCPFDDEYRPLLRALLFTVIDCRLNPRIASESYDSGQARVEKIRKLIQRSQWSIHDLSRMEPLSQDALPRFNMPFELGLDFGAKFFGSAGLRRKRFLILEKGRYRYQRVLSDISGNDIAAHRNEPEKLVRGVRQWIRSEISKDVPGPTRLWVRLNEFYRYFVTATSNSGYTSEDREEMGTTEFIDWVNAWEETR